jgi:16S rRNA (adenine1518-N6/adenine1519-N6)-dimethyltransferase
VEEALHAPTVVRSLLDRHGLRADKAFGQNFLVDMNALEAVVDAAELKGNETVLEVGPGLGVLTRELTRRAGRVVSVELDRRLVPVLQETVGRADNLEIVLGDALEFDFDLLPPGSFVIANLPYNIATPFIARALESCVFARIVVMVQKEVAQRLVAAPGSDAYGSVSLLVAHFARARIVRHVAPGCFYPPPDVTSSIVRLDVRTDARPRPDLFRLIRDAFRHRRKTLAKNLQMAGHDRLAVADALKAEGLDSRVRAERLGLDEFAGLHTRLQAGT